jgi:hypothetical protein
MIDFANIKHTTAGLDCHYLSQRKSGDQVLHRFAVVNSVSETICYYNDNGRRIDFCGARGWVEVPDGHQIIKPPRRVQVTRWLCFKFTPTDIENPVAVHLWDCEPPREQIENAKFFKVEKIIKTIEVPE